MNSNTQSCHDVWKWHTWIELVRKLSYIFFQVESQMTPVLIYFTLVSIESQLRSPKNMYNSSTDNFCIIGYSYCIWVTHHFPKTSEYESHIIFPQTKFCFCLTSWHIRYGIDFIYWLNILICPSQLSTWWERQTLKIM